MLAFLLYTVHVGNARINWCFSCFQGATPGSQFVRNLTSDWCKVLISQVKRPLSRFVKDRSIVNNSSSLPAVGNVRFVCHYCSGCILPVLWQTRMTGHWWMFDVKLLYICHSIIQWPVQSEHKQAASRFKLGRPLS